MTVTSGPQTTTGPDLSTTYLGLQLSGPVIVSANAFITPVLAISTVPGAFFSDVMRMDDSPKRAITLSFGVVLEKAMPLAFLAMPISL